MKTITRELLESLIDFAPTQEAKNCGFAEDQFDGTVAIYNMLARNRIAYLADEVGMGKTYVALGVMSVLRRLHPEARVAVIAPRENIQRKWTKELENFVRLNWKTEDSCVKSVQGTPAWEPVLCHSLYDFGHQASLNADRDFFLRMTSFSLRLSGDDAPDRHNKAIKGLVPWLKEPALRSKRFTNYRDGVGRALNALVPPIDLLIVDEAHNLKHGFGENSSNRNRIMGLAFGHPEGKTDYAHWYGRRVKRVLLLSATPFEDNYAAILRQLQVFGFGKTKISVPGEPKPLCVADLGAKEVGIEHKRKIVGQIMVRRVSSLRIAGESYTKNMYRREWRRGGVYTHDEPMAIEDPKQRLVVALIQKKLAEVLHSERFNNRFQIGMLSSFESFLETVKGSQALKKANSNLEEVPEESVFDGDQETTEVEKFGADTDAISQVVSSYREEFGESLPHPKLDTTCDRLKDAFETGEKTLVFVRRIATVDELAAKLDHFFDQWIRKRLENLLPELHQEIDGLFTRYERERKRRPEDILEEQAVDEDEVHDEEEVDLRNSVDDDPGSAETFFAWFFRGAGPKRILSGAAFHKNRLVNTGAYYSTLFEDNYLAWLLDYPKDVVGALAQALEKTKAETIETLRRRSYQHFLMRSEQSDTVRRLYVYEAYQAVALELLGQTQGGLGPRAQIIVQERYREVATTDETEAVKGYPEPEAMLGVETFFTKLAARPALRSKIWPDEMTSEDENLSTRSRGQTFLEDFRRREQRRELLSTTARLGASYIDLYALAIREIGSFKMKREASAGVKHELPDAYLDLLESQMKVPKVFHAFRELHDAAFAFDYIISVNFPKVPSAPLGELSSRYSRVLQRQVPVGRMSGGVSRRLVSQFRMPGFPLVLVSTDVLQEGEDLHTFCQNVIHYGITWTPSAMEQRTGRIDRIGGLLQRRLDGRKERPDESEFLQVYYPYLEETIEVLQVRRVLARLNRFIRLINLREVGKDQSTTRIDANRAFLEEVDDIEPIRGRLESAFPVLPTMREGQLMAHDVKQPQYQDLEHYLEEIWLKLQKTLHLDVLETGDARTRSGVVRILDGQIVSAQSSTRIRRQRFTLSFRSQVSGGATLLRCESPVGQIDLRDHDNLDKLYDLQRDFRGLKVCIHPNERLRVEAVAIESDVLFTRETTQINEVEALVSRVSLAADKIEQQILQIDADSLFTARRKE